MTSIDDALKRVVTDRAFRLQVLGDLIAAVRSYGLSADEQQRLVQAAELLEAGGNEARAARATAVDPGPPDAATQPPSFSAVLRAQAEAIWATIFAHPFLTELAAGTLPEANFRFYLVQDYHFLAGYARAVALALAKAPDSDSLVLLAHRVLVPVERELHRQLFARLGITEREADETPLAPTTRAYVNHLIATAALDDAGVTAAAILPCPWTYHLLGERLGEVGHPVFREWAAVYQQGLLAESVRAWRTLVDGAGRHAAPVRRRLEDAFLTSSRYEYGYWDMAYRREAWPH